MCPQSGRSQARAPSTRLRVAGMIPARHASTRLPGKPLHHILGISMIERVYQRCRASDALDELIVVTDDKRIIDVVEGFGGRAVMTRPDHSSGTDRLAEAVEQVNCDIVANIQGDQPFVDPGMIREVVQPILENPEVELATLMFRIEKEEDLHNVGAVKVVVNLAGDAMYFSRALIPWPHKEVAHRIYEHMGLYAYRKATLRKIAALPVTVLEQVESLEQLRWLEHGIRIRVVETTCTDRAFSGFSIDTLQDVKRGEAMLRERGFNQETTAG